MQFLKELWVFFKTRKKWWLILIVLTQGSVVAPFIYTVF